MRNRILCLALTLSGLLLPGLAPAQDKSEFSDALKSFGESYAKLNQVNETFTRQIAPHMTTFDSYRAWMEATTKRLSSSAVNAQDLTLAFKQYRDFLKNDSTCSSASLQTLQSDLHSSLRDLRSGLSRLKDSAGNQPKADKKSKKGMALSIAEAEQATRKAETIINSYSETLGSSNICTTLSNYDLILVATETLRATQATRTPLYLQSYLGNRAPEKDPQQIKAEAKTYLQAIEDSLRDNLRSGNIAQSLMLLNRLDGNLAFGTSAVKTLSEAERSEFENLKVQTKLAVKTLTHELAFPSFEGMVAMARTKAAATHELLTNVERRTVRASDQSTFAAVQDYCLVNFGMKTNEPYPTPKLKNLEEVLEFEAKLSEAQYQLRSLEKSRELASR